MLKIKNILFIAAVTFSTISFAADKKSKPEFAWIPEVGTPSSFQTELGLGLLDNHGITGHLGTPIYLMFKGNFAISEATSLFIDLPLAGTFSGGPDDFGIGNISMGANHLLLDKDSVSVGAGVNVTFPTSQNKSAIGVFTRSFTSFIKDQYAISPYLNLGFSEDRFEASLDVGVNEQVFTNRVAGQDRLDTVIFYDGGVSMAINHPKDFFATLEFSGYTPVTYTTNTTQFFGGPGVRYQDEEFSMGLHMMAPFSSPSRDQIDFLILTDVRFKF